MRIVLTGGGTGGHVTPLIAVKNRLAEMLGPEAEIMYIGSGTELEKEFVNQAGLRAKYVLSGKRRRYFSVQNFLDFFKAPIGFLQSLWILLIFMPDVVFSKGGYASVPVILAASIYRIPIIVHESDAVPGSANRLLAKFANNVVLAYPSAQEFFESARVAIFGNPVRPEVVGGDPAAARTALHLTESRPTVFFFGGSQGAQIINWAVVEGLNDMLRNFQIIHQIGQTNYDEVIKYTREKGVKEGRDGYLAYKLMDAETLKNAYAAADLVVSRAGANSIAEIAANGKPCILIPLANSANDHQRMNAYEIAKIGGALVLEESNLGQHILLQKINDILQNQELKSSMSERVRAFYHPQAADNIAQGIIRLGSR